jgi:hypothetical protein
MNLSAAMLFALVVGVAHLGAGQGATEEAASPFTGRWLLASGRDSGRLCQQGGGNLEISDNGGLLGVVQGTANDRAAGDASVLPVDGLGANLKACGGRAVLWGIRVGDALLVMYEIGVPGFRSKLFELWTIDQLRDRLVITRTAGGNTGDSQAPESVAVYVRDGQRRQ